MSNQVTQTKSIVPILLVNFIGTMGYSIVLPFLIVLVLEFGGNEFIYGILGATYSFFQLIGAPILGTWSDRIGRRKVLMLSQAGTFLAWVLFLVALVLPQTQLFTFLTLPLFVLFLARALDGITGGNVSVANAYLADISTEANRKQHFGQMAASGNMGFIIGPALAGILGATLLGNILPVLVAMLVSLIAIGVIYFRLQESNPCELSKAADPQQTRKILGQEIKECHPLEGEDRINFWQIIRLPNIAWILSLHFLIFSGLQFFLCRFSGTCYATIKLDDYTTWYLLLSAWRHYGIISGSRAGTSC